MSDINIFVEINNHLKNQFKEAMKEKVIQKKILEVEDFLEKNNTEPMFIIEYLKLKKEMGDNNLYDLLIKFETCVFKDKFNLLFGEQRKKVGYYEKISKLFIDIKNIINEKDEDSKLVKVIRIINMENEKYKQNFPIFYSINKELYFNSLYYRFVKKLKKEYFRYTKNINEDEIKEIKDKYINKINDLMKSNENSKNDLKISDLRIILDNIKICLSKKFILLMNNLSKFINNVYSCFDFRFNKNKIFFSEEYDESQNVDINLFSDFIFFLINFDYIKGKNLGFYGEIWKDTFEHITLEKLEIYSNNLVSFKKEEGNMKIKIQGENKEIKNIDNYKISSLALEIVAHNEMVEDFDLDEYLLMDKYDSNLYIKKHWNELSNYVVEILCSKTIQTVLTETFGNQKTLEYYKKDFMKNILDNLRYFNFNTKFVVETKKRYLNIYMRSYPSINSSDDPDMKKIIYLAVFLIACIHEIIGHLFLRIHNYLFKDKQITSPKPNNPSPYARKRGKESGEFIEELLFGKYNCRMTVGQILFILDKKNYSLDLEQFQIDFKKCETIENINISDDLKKIMELYEIEQSITENISSETFSVAKTKDGIEQIELPYHHKFV